jgi:hypothetical protein
LSQSSEGPPSFAAITFHRLAVGQAGVQGTIAPSTRAAAAVAKIRVHRVGEVDRRGAGRQLDDRGLRREDVDAVVETRAFGCRGASAPGSRNRAPTQAAGAAPPCALGDALLELARLH